MNEISVIIPCLNYEKFIFQNLEKVVEKIIYLKIKYEIIVINDNNNYIHIYMYHQSCN